MKQLFQHNGILYLVVRTMPSHQFHDKTGQFNNEKLKTWKVWLKCDHVLKHNEMYLFVEEIEVIEYEELPQEVIEQQNN